MEIESWKRACVLALLFEDKKNSKEQRSFNSFFSFFFRTIEIFTKRVHLFFFLIKIICTKINKETKKKKVKNVIRASCVVRKASKEEEREREREKSNFNDPRKNIEVLAFSNDWNIWRSPSFSLKII